MTVICPQCGGADITAIEDFEHEVALVECERCGLSFAERKRELYANVPMGDDDAAHALIQADWDMAYAQRPKLL